MTNEIAQGVKDEIKRTISWMDGQELNDQQIEGVIEAILSAQDEKGNNIKKIFVAGLGRSGFVAKGFAMRLAHVGFNVRVIDETTAPPFEKGDLFIIVSGSGASLTRQIVIAIGIGAKITVITSLSNSVAARLADIKFIIPGREAEGTEGASLSYDERQMKGLPAFPLGTAFESFATVTLDAIVAEIIKIKKKTEEDLKKKHSNMPER